jgi:hypothetical protein
MLGSFGGENFGKREGEKNKRRKNGPPNLDGGFIFLQNTKPPLVWETKKLYWGRIFLQILPMFL